MLKVLLSIIGFLLPWCIRRLYLNNLFGFEISESARVGLSIVLPRMLIMEPGSRIGHLTIFKGLDKVLIKAEGRVGNLNWVSGFPLGASIHFSNDPDRCPELIVREHAAITSRHIIDCTDRVEIGRFTTFAGFRSQILTHSIDLKTSRQRCKPVIIGAYCFVGTGSIIMGGARLPDYSILGAGSLLNMEYEDTHGLFGGVPAKRIKDIPDDYAYFHRSRGFVE